MDDLQLKDQKPEAPNPVVQPVPGVSTEPPKSEERVSPINWLKSLSGLKLFFVISLPILVISLLFNRDSLSITLATISRGNVELPLIFLFLVRVIFLTLILLLPAILIFSAITNRKKLPLITSFLVLIFLTFFFTSPFIMALFRNLSGIQILSFIQFIFFSTPQFLIALVSTLGLAILSALSSKPFFAKLYTGFLFIVAFAFFLINNTIGWVPKVYKQNNNQVQSNVSTDTIKQPPYGTYFYLDKLESNVGLDISGKGYDQQRAIYKLNPTGKPKKIFDKVFSFSTNLIISPDGTKVIDPKFSGSIQAVHNFKTGKTWKLEQERFQSPEGFLTQTFEELSHRNQDQWSPDNQYFLATTKYYICVEPCVWGSGKNIVGQKLVKINTEEFKLDTLVENRVSEKEAGGRDSDYLATNNSNVSMPSYSPDGTKIAYKSRVTVGAKSIDSDQIEVIDANSKSKLVTIQTPNSKSASNHRNDISNYFWSQDSKNIVYISSEKNFTQRDEKNSSKLIGTNDFIGQVNIETGDEKIITEESLGLGNLHLSALANIYSSSWYKPWRARLIGSDLIFIYKTIDYVPGTPQSEYVIYQISLTTSSSKILKKVPDSGYLPGVEEPILSRDGKWIIWGSTIENIESGEKRTILNQGEFLDWFVP